MGRQVGRLGGHTLHYLRLYSYFFAGKNNEKNKSSQQPPEYQTKTKERIVEEAWERLGSP